MSSQIQIEANRRNSRKSTGPRSAAGKATSSQNALGSGIYAESETIRDENASDLQSLAAAYATRFHPEPPDQRCLVDILVHSEWTLRRLRRAEAQLWEQNTDWSEPTIDENLHPLGRALNYDGSKVFARLQHRITATQRNYERALKELQRLQSDGPSTPPPAQPHPLPAPHPAPTPIGFVSSSGKQTPSFAPFAKNPRGQTPFFAPFAKSPRGQTPFFAPFAKNGCLSPGFNAPTPAPNPAPKWLSASGSFPATPFLAPFAKTPRGQTPFFAPFAKNGCLSPGFTAPTPTQKNSPPVLSRTALLAKQQALLS